MLGARRVCAELVLATLPMVPLFSFLLECPLFPHSGDHSSVPSLRNFCVFSRLHPVLIFPKSLPSGADGFFPPPRFMQLAAFLFVPPQTFRTSFWQGVDPLFSPHPPVFPPIPFHWFEVLSCEQYLFSIRPGRSFSVLHLFLPVSHDWFFFLSLVLLNPAFSLSFPFQLAVDAPLFPIGFWRGYCRFFLFSSCASR